MNTRKMLTLVLAAMMLVWATAATTPKPEPLVQLAILLDTSNSMDGLIDQAKTQLWKIVNEMARAKRDGQAINLQVGLYEYGKSSLPAGEGYLRMIVPLTNDLDKISDELFNLKTNGGDEYCGMVIKAATNGLQWSTNNNDLKIIVIAGNEPFTQGSVDYRQSCKDAIAKGIIVNTIFCGRSQEGIQTKWKDGADLADGKYMNIDQDQKIQQIDAPQDKEIVRLSEELNRTYLAYGKGGEKKKEMQTKQDANAATAGAPVMAERAVTKASAQYVNTGWDLVDADKSGSVKVQDLKDDELPAEMKNLKPEEREKYLKETAQKREEIQKKINQLNEDRRKFLTDQAKKAPENTLDAAMIKALREQAGNKQYTFDTK